MTRAFYFCIIAITIFLAGVALSLQYHEGSDQLQTSELSAADVPLASTTARKTQEPSASSSPKTTILKKANNRAINSVSLQTSGQVGRIEDPYTTPPETFDQVNSATRAALVNILCEPDGASSLNPISGSGVIIDPKGIILTNAHVAQYVLLSESPQVDLTCFIRTGSPATPTWRAAVLFIPPVWVSQHASEINDLRPIGTGEHDYAFLYISSAVDGTPLPAQFPYLPYDTRPAIAFPNDQVLVASYPAELVGGIAAQYDLYAGSSVTTVKQLMTFGQGTPDMVSLGGVIEAQEGSSGGAVVNAWGHLVALIATTSSGTSTADRDLRGIAISYIDADLEQQTGSGLDTFLARSPSTQLESFTSNIAPSLIQEYVTQLSKVN